MKSETARLHGFRCRGSGPTPLVKAWALKTTTRGQGITVRTLCARQLWDRRWPALPKGPASRDCGQISPALDIQRGLHKPRKPRKPRLLPSARLDAGVGGSVETFEGTKN